jgi:hypothetical protein
VMRPSDLVDADFETTTAELAELAAAGAVAREPAGTDAVWRATDTAAGEAAAVAAGSGRQQH